MACDRQGIDLMKVKVGAYSSVVGGSVHIHEDDGRLHGRSLSCAIPTHCAILHYKKPCAKLWPRLCRSFLQRPRRCSMGDRITLSRAKGWRKPEGAIIVARPS